MVLTELMSASEINARAALYTDNPDAFNLDAEVYRRNAFDRQYKRLSITVAENERKLKKQKQEKAAWKAFCEESKKEVQVRSFFHCLVGIALEGYVSKIGAADLDVASIEVQDRILATLCKKLKVDKPTENRRLICDASNRWNYNSGDVYAR